jgi:hypothetical protein
MPPMTRTKAVAWAGGASYLLVVGLLVGGAPRASGTVHGVGALLAVSLLAGVVRRMPLLALAMALFGSTAVVVGPPRSSLPHPDDAEAVGRAVLGGLGGHLSTGPRPEGGFRVAARLPLPAPIGVPVEAR